MMKNYDKIYDDWNEVKKDLSKKTRKFNFNEDEVWWCSIGMNLGSEIYGKSKFFSRPVLIIRKNYDHSFIGLPLTTKLHNGSWYEPLFFNGQEQRVVLNQVKDTSTLRLYRRIGTVKREDYIRIVVAFTKYITKNILPQPKQREQRIIPKMRSLMRTIYDFIISHSPDSCK